MWEPMPSGWPMAAWAAYDRAQGVSQVAAPNKSPNSGAFNLDRFEHALQRKPLTGKALRSKWTGPGLNRRHTDFQSVALPTELPVRLSKAYRGLSWNQPLQSRQPARLAPAPLVGARSRVVNAEKPRSDSTTDMSHAALRACSAEAIACKIIA